MFLAPTADKNSRLAQGSVLFRCRQSADRGACLRAPNHRVGALSAYFHVFGWFGHATQNPSEGFGLTKQSGIKKERHYMLDTIFLIATVAFFALAVAYVWGCEKL